MTLNIGMIYTIVIDIDATYNFMVENLFYFRSFRVQIFVLNSLIMKFKYFLENLEWRHALCQICSVWRHLNFLVEIFIEII
jgi:hypothetical protein